MPLLLEVSVVARSPSSAPSPAGPMPSLSRALVWFVLAHLAPLVLLVAADLLPADSQNAAQMEHPAGINRLR
jgi:hypothetical protein